MHGFNRWMTSAKAARYATVAALALLALLALLCAALVFGAPRAAPPMASINDPFRKADFSDLPALSHFAARDGAKLAYRRYAPAGREAVGSVILVHGSSASSASMHLAAKAFAAAGYAVYALDMRGHGASGAKGRIDHVGQLEEDVEDFMHAASPKQPATLAGFSSGGGFALRMAGSARQDLFQNCLLLSPFLGPYASTYRPNSGGWVSVGVPRIVAIDLLNRIGVHAFDGLTVVKFALDEHARSILTPSYSYALTSNFGPHRDYASDMRSARLPCAVVAGEDDEVFDAQRFETEFRAHGKDWPVSLVPHVGHIPLILEPAALRRAVASVDALRSGERAAR